MADQLLERLADRHILGRLNHDFGLIKQGHARSPIGRNDASIPLKFIVVGGNIEGYGCVERVAERFRKSLLEKIKEKAGGIGIDIIRGHDLKFRRGLRMQGAERSQKE